VRLLSPALDRHEASTRILVNQAAIHNHCSSKRPLLRADSEQPNGLESESNLPDGQARSRALKRTTCSDEARRDKDVDMSVDELAGYFDEQVHIPRKMSFMAELMYT